MSSGAGSVAARVLAGIVGGVALITLGVFSLGTVLIAPIGMALMAMILQRRGKHMSMLASWIGAVGASSLLVAGLFAFGATRSKAFNIGQLLRTTDSVSIAQQDKPPPEWLEKVAPGTAVTQRRQRMLLGEKGTRGLAHGSMVVGLLLGVELLGMLAGSIGWAFGMLMGYAFKGRWPGQHQELPLGVPGT